MAVILSKKLTQFFLLIGALILNSNLGWSYGEINVQNGNYKTFIPLISLPGSDLNLELSLAYNSRSQHNGLFGYGWANNLETKFEILPSGNVSITEFGGGYRFTFIRANWSKEEMGRFADKILSAMAKENPGIDREKMRNLLLQDPNKRESLARQYDIATSLSDIAPGTQFVSRELGHQLLQRELKGWSRIRADGSIDVFSGEGQLLAKKSPNNHTLRFEYDERRRLIAISDDTPQTIRLSYNARGKVHRVTSPARNYAFFYDALDNLIGIQTTGIKKETASARFEMAYDKLSNLSRIRYSDGKIEKMGYNLEKDWITSHEIGNVKTAYKYGFDPNDTHHFWISVIKTVGNDPKPRILADRYEYYQELRDDGSLFNRKVIVTRGGATTETTFARCCGKPESIKQNGLETKFEYDPDSGLLKKKITPDQEVTELFYEPKTARISKIHHSMPYTENEKRGYEYETTTFRYNAQGQLAYAHNQYARHAVTKLLRNAGSDLLFPEKGTEIKSVKLGYDSEGRVHHMEDNENHILTFQYSQIGKPTTIALRGVGTIYVEYNDKGEIAKVRSPKETEKGREVASSIVQTFQNLLDVIRPAGVDLSF